MREINVEKIKEEVARLCIQANRFLPEDLKKCLNEAEKEESNSLAKGILCDLCDNLEAADCLGIPICQDTGMAVVFLEIGQEVHLVGGSLCHIGFKL